MWYDTAIKLDWLNRRELINNDDGIGYALSVVTGRKITLNQEWTMTPQVKLSHNALGFDSFNDAYNVHVSRDDGDA
ncbi:outer membrane autotransporter barrel domain-containing protein [Bartonella tamiae Th307]|uniref:Outer membrane autotransporter barrel domain-containing protein n=1 Tax=Bartonella tamiae Th239 TaxID=1094558 RepID=J1JW42_9HYPH|nr:autotransporter domain-containing protein [Bartonella tamiae]EJF89217.1 outer membrane autotransporter barrel domain-containing protein [Bartonella tamiae Th239]EJF95379.1 outer membrane autotransporter barrel domain-containing protein [Bartonella tamiae Th307]